MLRLVRLMLRQQGRDRLAGVVGAVTARHGFLHHLRDALPQVLAEVGVHYGASGLSSNRAES